MNKIETEYKLELSAKEFVDIKNQLKNGIYLNKESKLQDYFFNVERFDEKGWNFTRIRVYDESRYQRTDKIWKIINGERLREELERDTNIEELVGLKEKNPGYLFLNKTRTDFAGEFFGYNGTISLDEVVFSDETRYFIELEIEAPAEQSQAMRPQMRQYLLDTFKLSDREEGIGMMRLVIQKSGKLS